MASEITDGKFHFLFVKVFREGNNLRNKILNVKLDYQHSIKLPIRSDKNFEKVQKMRNLVIGCLHLGRAENSDVVKFSSATVRKETTSKRGCRRNLSIILNSELMWSVGLRSPGIFGGKMRRFVVNDEALDVEQLLEFRGRGGDDLIFV